MTEPGAAADGLAVASAGLTKRFGAKAAVDGIDLAVPYGAVFGFLGPNGSGKTTTIRVMLGLAAATAGRVEVLGRGMPQGVRAVLPEVGALVEGPAFYPFLSGSANLSRLDTANRDAPTRTRRARIDAALERVGLSAAAGLRVRAYSLGMKQRLGLAAALLTPRRLLVLDEPTNGLDPQGTREVRGLIRGLAADGTTVFLSSHLLAEVEQVCSHVGVMSNGRLVAQGRLEELRAGGRAVLRLITPDPGPAGDVLVGVGVEAVHTGNGGELVGTLPAGAGGETTERLVAALVSAGVRVRGVAVERPSLEDRYVALTGEGFEVER